MRINPSYFRSFIGRIDHIIAINGVIIIKAKDGSRFKGNNPVVSGYADLRPKFIFGNDYIIMSPSSFEKFLSVVPSKYVEKLPEIPDMEVLSRFYDRIDAFEFLSTVFTKKIASQRRFSAKNILYNTITLELARRCGLEIRMRNNYFDDFGFSWPSTVWKKSLSGKYAFAVWNFYNSSVVDDMFRRFGRLRNIEVELIDFPSTEATYFIKSWSDIEKLSSEYGDWVKGVIYGLYRPFQRSPRGLQLIERGKVAYHFWKDGEVFLYREHIHLIGQDPQSYHIARRILGFPDYTSGDVAMGGQSP